MDNFRTFLSIFELVLLLLAIGILTYLYFKPAKPQTEACMTTCSDQCAAACNDMCTSFYIISQESPKE